MEEQERVVSQAFERNSDDVPRAREPCVSVGYLGSAQLLLAARSNHCSMPSFARTAGDNHHGWLRSERLRISRP